MTGKLTGSGTKQGDHVFNDLNTAVERPIEFMRNVQTKDLNGDHFLTDFLPHGRDLARRILRDPIWSKARQYAATPGQERDAVTRLNRVAGGRSLLKSVTEHKLVQIHLQNADGFGRAVRRFESELLQAMRHALTVAVQHPDSPNNSNLIFGVGSPVIAFQSLVNEAFDPAAALVVVIMQADQANALGQSSVLGFLESVWGVVDPPRPAL